MYVASATFVAIFCSTLGVVASIGFWRSLDPSALSLLAIVLVLGSTIVAALAALVAAPVLALFEDESPTRSPLGWRLALIAAGLAILTGAIVDINRIPAGMLGPSR